MTQALLLRITVAATSAFVLFAAIFTLPFAALPMAYVGLAYGATQAALVAGVTLLITGIILGPPLAITLLIVFLLPTYILVRQALLSRAQVANEEDAPTFVFYPLRNLILLTLAVSALGTVVAFLTLGGTAGLPQSLANALMASAAISSTLSSVYQISSPEEFLHLANLMLIASFATWPLLVLGNAQAAQGILVKQGKNLRPANDYQTLSLPPSLALVFAGLLSLSLVTDGWVSTLAAALAAVVLAAYFLLGLAIIHAISRNWNGRVLILATLYFLLFVMAWVSIPVSLMGLLDARLDFRGLRKHPDKPSNSTGDKE
tara:strand:- start:1087 stop:2037 length:951 start_codon:yes stop_codon:yes gene_type:complete